MSDLDSTDSEFNGSDAGTYEMSESDDGEYDILIRNEEKLTKFIDPDDQPHEDEPCHHLTDEPPAEEPPIDQLPTDELGHDDGDKNEDELADFMIQLGAMNQEADPETIEETTEQVLVCGQSAVDEVMLTKFT